MRDIKEILRLRYHLKHSHRIIADAMGIARSTVRDYLSRVHAANLQWPLPGDMSNEQLLGDNYPDRLTTTILAGS